VRNSQIIDYLGNGLNGAAWLRTMDREVVHSIHRPTLLYRFVLLSLITLNDLENNSDVSSFSSRHL